MDHNHFNSILLFCISSTFWICILTASIIAMATLFVYTLNDYRESPVVINVDTIISNKNNVFPAVSICARKWDNKRASTKRLKQFVRKYYANHNIEEPQE